MIQSVEPLYDLLNKWRNAEEYPYFPVIEEILGSSVAVEEQNGELSYLMLASCDYLGMSRDDDVKKAAIKGIEIFGTNTFGAQIFSGYTSIHRDLERKLAQYIGKEVALLFPSGMHANIGTITTMMGQDDVIINDQYNHASILMGSKLSDAQVRTFPHNNMQRLEKLLENSQDKRKRMIIVDGLFSADGDYAPLDRICDLAEQYDALVMVDEAHSMGVCGPTGRGACELFNVIDRVDIIMGTMSKGIGSVGGFIAASHEIEDVLRHFSVPYLNSRGLSPAAAAAALASLTKLSTHGDNIREKLWKNTRYLIEQFRTQNVNILNTETPIIPVIVGDFGLTMKVVQWLKKKGILVSAMVYPSVPTGRLRLGVTPWLTEEDCKRTVELICEAKLIFGF
ncbi:pyridoxal phosphate-dependent aminotransferase family protein [Paenibacillus sp. FSL P2-0136]|uniref:aminotransferase class I/II-fold pyridoxal phosphate-dependent enzyme n=1 Tax=Paenibacillus sp. FSL P2-0136 TaxID=2975317 RepID=UPI0030DC9B24